MPHPPKWNFYQGALGSLMLIISSWMPWNHDWCAGVLPPTKHYLSLYSFSRHALNVPLLPEEWTCKTTNPAHDFSTVGGVTAATGWIDQFPKCIIRHLKHGFMQDSFFGFHVVCAVAALSLRSSLVTVLFSLALVVKSAAAPAKLSGCSYPSYLPHWEKAAQLSPRYHTNNCQI